MRFANCPKCGSMNITTAGVCANCGWSQFAQVTKVSTPIEDALRKRIAELEEERRWRVVADGDLPEVYRDEDGDFIPFLVCEGDGGYPFIAMYDGINWRAGIFVPDITHWMPLPEPPIMYGKESEE